MKPFTRFSKPIFGLIITLTAAILAPTFAWVQEPTEQTGYYYAYDNEETEPPFSEPELPPLPTYKPIHSNPEALDLDYYIDHACPYTLPDSFWFYGQWHVPGDTVFISPNGYISFDKVDHSDFPHPPFPSTPFPNQAAPNSLIAPLWQDNWCGDTKPEDYEHVYCLYVSQTRILKIEWHNMIGIAASSVYDYMTELQLGGQELLSENEYGVIFSNHFIHFLYNSCSHSWNTDNGSTGFEDQTGEHGIYYPYENLIDERVIRIGYKNPYSAVKEEGLPFRIKTLGVRPMPGGCRVTFTIPATSKVKLDAFDVSGRHIRTLADRSYPQGTHTKTWDGCDAQGHKVAQGAYLVHMVAEDFRAAKKIILY
ncbi:hypothetical protein JXM67_04245 [candidate division WOR-3 bacterium]|nr:hypothetical protein [candidate division WOR-3 bacterium]